MREGKRALLGTAVLAAVGVVLVLGGLGVFGAGRGATVAEAKRGAAPEDRIVAAASDHPAAMKHLAHLAKDIGPRPAGSQSFVKACKWAQGEFRRFGVKSARLEKVEWEGGPLYNVVADIEGADVPDEYVIVGAHIDGAPEINAATDDGAGVAAVMEAARILAKSGARPARTIRFILFGGEEVGLIGSKGYLESHPEIASKVSAVYVMDHGANFISGIEVTPPMAADLREAFSAVATLDPERPFEVKEVDYLEAAGLCEGDGKGAPGVSSSCGSAGAKASSCGPTIIRKKGPSPAGCGALGGSPREIGIFGSSDYAPFLYAGIPAFAWNQVVDEANPYPAHTAEDTYDKVNPANLEHSATVIALGALGTANLDHMLSRERLMDPSAEAADTGCAGKSAADTGCGAAKSTSSSCCGSQSKKSRS
jgi:hypothetical protein